MAIPFGIDASVARVFLSSAGLPPALIDVVIELAPKMRAAKFERLACEDLEVFAWRMSGVTTDGNFDLVIRVCGQKLASAAEKIIHQMR